MQSVRKVHTGRSIAERDVEKYSVRIEVIDCFTGLGHIGSDADFEVVLREGLGEQARH
jgi:hypothetical protein